MLPWRKPRTHSQQLLTLSGVSPPNVSVLREAIISTSICGYAASAWTHTQTHTSIFRHAASAWRCDTTTSVPKNIQGHCDAASHHMQSSLFSRLHSKMWNPNLLCLPESFNKPNWGLCMWTSVRVFSHRAEGPWNFRLSKGDISISACWVVMSHLYCCSCCSCCCEQNI